MLAPAAPLESTAPASSAEEPAPSAEAPRTPLADPPNYRVVAGGSGANLRREPSTTAAVVQQLRDGAVVTNLDEQRAAGGITWRRVAEGTVDGWVSAELLVPER